MDTRDKSTGRFVKGISSSPATQFKKGEHWRERKPIWDKEWLFAEYIINKRSASDIASEVGVLAPAVYHWLRKHKIPRRSVSEAREVKHWGSSGENNPMFGKRGVDTPNWSGGVTPERQAFYSSIEWAKACRVVWKRDGSVCKKCGAGKKDKKIHIHHIVSFSVKEKRAEINNLILLCEDCHHWVHSKKNKEREFIK